jgi:hypothetical protein
LGRSRTVVRSGTTLQSSSVGGDYGVGHDPDLIDSLWSGATEADAFDQYRIIVGDFPSNRAAEFAHSLAVMLDELKAEIGDEMEIFISARLYSNPSHEMCAVVDSVRETIGRQ